LDIGDQRSIELHFATARNVSQAAGKRYDVGEIRAMCLAYVPSAIRIANDRDHIKAEAIEHAGSDRTDAAGGAGEHDGLSRDR
jgi:hypothetical protein